MSRPAHAGVYGPPRTRTFGIGSLGTRRERYWFAVLGALALALPYIGVIGASFRAAIEAPAAVEPLPPLSVAVATFPQLALPALHPERALAVPPLRTTSTRVIRRGTRRVASRRVVRTRRHLVRRKAAGRAVRASGPEGCRGG
ncbi:MAG TPA: hypothetical protein VGH56_05730 [Solirubrobacteraceae bacterium]